MDGTEGQDGMRRYNYGSMACMAICDDRMTRVTEDGEMAAPQSSRVEVVTHPAGAGADEPHGTVWLEPTAVPGAP